MSTHVFYHSNLYMCESTSFSHLHVAFHFQVNVIILKNWTWLSCTRHTFTNFDKKKVCCSSRDATIKLCQFVSMNSTQPKTKMWAEKTLSSVQLGAFLAIEFTAVFSRGFSTKKSLNWIQYHITAFVKQFLIKLIRKIEFAFFPFERVWKTILFEVEKNRNLIHLNGIQYWKNVENLRKL